MKLFNGVKVAAIAALFCFSGVSMSAEFFLDGGADLAKAGNRATVLVGFSGSQDITDSQTDVTYDPKAVSVTVKAFGAAGCSNPSPGLVRVTSPDLGGKALGEKVGAYCQITVQSLTKSALPKDALKLANVFCSGTAGIQKSCSAGDELSIK